MRNLIKPAILKNVIIGNRPKSKTDCEDKIIHFLINLGEEEKRIYEFIQSYETISEWIESYLNDKLSTETEATNVYLLNLLNALLDINYYKPYYNENNLKNVIGKSLETLKKSINMDLICFNEKDMKFYLVSDIQDEQLNKDRYLDLFNTFNSLKK